MVDATPKRITEARVTNLISHEVRCDVPEPGTAERMDLAAAVVECKKEFNELQFMEKNGEDGTIIVEVQNRRVYIVPDASYMSVSRIVFSQTTEGHVKYAVQALFTNVQTGIVENISKFKDVCSIVADCSEYKFCPGISKEKYEEYHSVIRYHIKSIRIWDQPFKRIDSRNCLLLHQLAANAKYEERVNSSVLCKACKRLLCDLAHQRNRSTISPSKQLKRLQPSSTFKLMHLSPASVAKRKRATQQERSRDKAKLLRHDDLDITFEEDQSDELSNVVTKLEEVAKKDLDMIFSEADDKNVGGTVREIWESDLRKSKLEFFKDQQRNSKQLALQSECMHHLP